MSAAAVLRFAGRSLRLPASSSFPRALVQKGQRLSPPVEKLISTRRLYSSDCVAGKTAELINKHTPLDPHTRLLNSGQQQHVMPTKRLRPLDESTLRKLDEINRVYDRMEITLKELELVIKQKNERIYRRRRTLAGGCILAGLGIYLKRRFSGREKDKKE